MVRRVAAGFVLAVVVVVVALGDFAGYAFAEDAAMELSRALRQAKLFAGLTDDERAALKSVATLRHGREGERIIEQGKPSGRMFIVLEGEAEVRVNGKLVATLPAQALVGEIEFLDKLPATADVLLLKETNLIELNHAPLTELMEKQPRLGYVLMREIARIEARRLRRTTQK
jgi:CRP-like cAMP-binding protein